MNDINNLLINWARELQSLAQTGLAFAQTEYEIDRYSRIMKISAEMISNSTQFDNDKLFSILMEQPGYATPKVDVRTAIVKDNKILLVKEINDGKWAMPGGWMDVGDYPAAAAEREAKEESGFEVKAKKVVGVYDANRNGSPMEFFHAVKIVYLCDIIGGEPAASKETSEVQFFSFDNLPPFSENRTNKKHIDDILKCLNDKEFQAAFD